MKRSHTTIALVAAVFCNGGILRAEEPKSDKKLDWISIGDPNNPPDSNGYGSVGWPYAITKNRVSNYVYADFLNCVDLDGSNPKNLYHPAMNATGGILLDRSAPEGQKYTVAKGDENKPVTFVNWYDAARFANFLCNGGAKGSSTESGAYNLRKSKNHAIVREKKADYWIPCEDELYKAAFYSPAGKWFREKKLYSPVSSSTPETSETGAIKLPIEFGIINDIVDAISPIARKPAMGDLEENTLPFRFAGALDPNTENFALGFHVASSKALELWEPHRRGFADLFGDEDNFDGIGGVPGNVGGFGGGGGGSGTSAGPLFEELPPVS